MCGTCRSRRLRLLPRQPCPSQALQRARLKRRRKPGQVCQCCSLTFFSPSSALRAWHACRSFLNCIALRGPGLWGSLRGALAQAVGFIKGAKTQATQRQQVRDTFAKHQAALTELSSRLAALDRKLGLDFGPSGVFAELLDRCAQRPHSICFACCVCAELHPYAAPQVLFRRRGQVHIRGVHVWRGAAKGGRSIYQPGVMEGV